MKRLLIGVLSALIANWSATSARAEDSHSRVAAGRHLALQVCSACHVVVPDQEFARSLDHIASFEEIANKPDMSAESLRQFLTATHWGPSPILTDEQIPQMIGYILSLRKDP